MALTKILNGENKSFQPVLTDKLVYDTKPTVNSFNGITSDAVARAIAGASGEVPQVTESDNGKILTAIYDSSGAAMEWADAQGGAEYSAGTGISISAQDEISVDTTVIATKNDLSSYQPTISDLETIRSGASAGATAVQPDSLATVATSGSYNDLSNKPSIPAAQVNSDWNAASGVAQILNKPSLATVATSGSYNDLSNKPTIPAAQIQSDWNQTNDQAADFIKNKPNIPAGVVVDQSYSASSTNAQSGTAVAGALATINQVPASTSADEDKVLTVNSSGNAVWATPSGGGSSITIGTAPGGWQSLTDVCSYFQGPTTAVFGYRGSALTTAGSVQFDSLSCEYGFVTPNYQTGDQHMAVYVVLFYPYTYNNTSFNDFVFGPSIGSNFSPYQVHQCFQVISFTDEMNAFIASRQYPGEVGIGLYAGDKSESTLTMSNLCKFVNKNDPGTIAFDASWVKVAGSYVNTINRMPAGSPSFSTSTDAGKVLTVGSSGLEWATAPSELPSVTGNAGKVLTVNSGATGVEWATAPSELPSVTGNAGKVLTVNSGATGVEWATAQGGNVTDYAATYISSSNKPSYDWCYGIQTAMDNGQRIGLFVKMLAFSGSYSSGSVDPYDSNAKIYLPLASAIDKSEPDQWTTFVYEYNFFLYDGVNKLKITLTETWQNDTSTFVWSTPTISQ